MEPEVATVVAMFAGVGVIALYLPFKMLGIAILLYLGEKYYKKPKDKLGIGILFLMAVTAAVFI